MLDTKIIQTRSIFIKIISFLLLLKKFAKTLIDYLYPQPSISSDVDDRQRNCWISRSLFPLPAARRANIDEPVSN